MIVEKWKLSLLAAAETPTPGPNKFERLEAEEIMKYKKQSKITMSYSNNSSFESASLGW